MCTHHTILEVSSRRGLFSMAVKSRSIYYIHTQQRPLVYCSPLVYSRVNKTSYIIRRPQKNEPKTNRTEMIGRARVFYARIFEYFISQRKQQHSKHTHTTHSGSWSLLLRYSWRKHREFSCAVRLNWHILPAHTRHEREADAAGGKWVGRITRACSACKAQRSVFRRGRVILL